MDCEPRDRIVKDTIVLLPDSLSAIFSRYDVSLRELRQNFSYLLPKSLSSSHLYASLLQEIYNYTSISYKDLAICRKRGIPAYVDFTPHWSRPQCFRIPQACSRCCCSTPFALAVLAVSLRCGSKYPGGRLSQALRCRQLPHGKARRLQGTSGTSRTLYQRCTTTLPIAAALTSLSIRTPV